MKSREELQKVFARISKDFSFEDAHLELATDKRMDAIIKFARDHFAPDEPVGRSLKVEYDEEVEQILRHVFRENISVLLVSNSTDEIIAARLSCVSNKDNNDEEDMKKITNKKLITFATFISHKDKEFNAFTKYGVDNLIHFVMLGVDRRFRRKGIGTKIMEAAIKFYSEIGFDKVVIKGEGTSNYSKRIYEKLGFDAFHEMVYADYKVNGEEVFKDTGEHKSCIVYIKLMSSI